MSDNILPYYFQPYFDPEVCGRAELCSILAAQDVEYTVDNTTAELRSLVRAQVLPHAEAARASGALPDYLQPGFNLDACRKNRLCDILITEGVAHHPFMAKERIIELIRTEVLHQPLAIPSAYHFYYKYWEPGFDPAACSIEWLRKILIRENVFYDTSSSKEELVERVRTKVLPDAEAIRARYTNVQPSSEGTKNA